MIQSFSDADTEAFYVQGKKPKVGWQGIAAVAARKLDFLNAAASLDDLSAPPGNRLEALKGDRVGQHSIRINDKWRLCFTWTNKGPRDVEITAYH